MKAFFLCLALFTCFGLSAQPQRRWNGDTTHTNRPKMEKGPHKGTMFAKEGIKVEMVPPSNDKGDVVIYYVYDSLNRTLDTKLFGGTVKYVFGTAAEYLEARLIASSGNKYTATLEGWQEYKKAIVTLKTLDKTYTFFFLNPNNMSQAQQGSGGHHGGHGHGGHHGGGSGTGAMGSGGMGSGRMGGSMGGGNGF